MFGFDKKKMGRKSFFFGEMIKSNGQHILCKFTKDLGIEETLAHALYAYLYDFWRLTFSTWTVHVRLDQSLDEFIRLLRLLNGNAFNWIKSTQAIVLKCHGRINAINWCWLKGVVVGLQWMVKVFRRATHVPRVRDQQINRSSCNWKDRKHWARCLLTWIFWRRKYVVSYLSFFLVLRYALVNYFFRFQVGLWVSYLISLNICISH